MSNTTGPVNAKRITWADAPFIVVALASGVWLLYLGRSLTFWFDEWRSITFDGELIDYFQPVNEHWSTVPLLLYRATFEVVELRSYLPYLAELVLLHLVAVTAAYVLMRRRLGAPTAVLLALPLLLLGVGAENLYWAFQTGFVASVAFGLWALVLVERKGPRSWIGVSFLLIASLAASGIGLFFLVALAARTSTEARYRRRTLATLPPAVVYLFWHAAFGRDALGTTGELAGPFAVIRFTLAGVGYSVEALAGLDRLPTERVVGVLVVAVLAGIAVRRTLAGRQQGLAIGCLLGLVSMYALIGVARAELDFDYTTRGRYVYVAGFFVVLCVADLLQRSELLETGRVRSGMAIATGAVLVLAWVVAININSLLTVRTQFQFQADVTRAVIELALENEGAPWLDPEAGLDLMPPAGELPALIEEHGSPLEDEYFPWVVPLPQAAACADARRYLSRPQARPHLRALLQPRVTATASSRRTTETPSGASSGCSSGTRTLRASSPRRTNESAVTG